MGCALSWGLWVDTWAYQKHTCEVGAQCERVVSIYDGRMTLPVFFQRHVFHLNVRPLFGVGRLEFRGPRRDFDGPVRFSFAARQILDAVRLNLPRD